MSERLLHTPEGVRDIYGDEYAKKVRVETLLRNKIHGFGYEDIQTPNFEFFEVFSKETGTTPSKELYKFFDKEGNTLVLRPDFTPSIARCAAKYFMYDEFPLRFCYEGNTFTNNSNLQGKLKEITQMGAELINDGSVEADAEIIALVIEALFHTGLTEFQISVGNVEYFKGICAEAGIDEETELELRDKISGKNYFGAEELLLEKKINEKDRESLLSATELYGSIDIIKEASKKDLNERSKAALERLEKLHKVLTMYGVEKYVSYDLGMLSNYNYYTGIIFKAYTYGVGDAIVKGGRYDNLLSRFGKKAPAVGFMVVVDDLLSAMNRQNIMIQMPEKVVTVSYNDSNFEQKLHEVKCLRLDGRKVALVPEK